jgi:hypothetical protein
MVVTVDPLLVVAVVVKVQSVFQLVAVLTVVLVVLESH